MVSKRRSPARATNERKGLKYHKARLRRFVFTHGPDRLSRGRIRNRHLRNETVVREMEISSDRWPKAFDGLRIGHLSDLHVGELMPVDRAVDEIELLASQGVDLIACTGDVIDLHISGTEPVFEALAAAESTLGTFLVLGNHDELENRTVVAEMAVAAGVMLLENECASVAHNGATLEIGGVNWARTIPQCTRFVRAACQAGTHLLLSHNPKSFREASRMGLPLTLAGHTHGGQVAMKNRPNANLSLSHRHSAGVFEKNGAHLFVTTGVGAWFPLRINCPAEVAVITMRASTDAS